MPLSMAEEFYSFVMFCKKSQEKLNKMYMIYNNLGNFHIDYFMPKTLSELEVLYMIAPQAKDPLKLIEKKEFI